MKRLRRSERIPSDAPELDTLPVDATSPSRWQIEDLGHRHIGVTVGCWSSKTDG